MLETTVEKLLRLLYKRKWERKRDSDLVKKKVRMKKKVQTTRYLDSKR